eukprot:scaffold20973_cov53-Phaeocystis_antarctica.AAC.3
MLTDERRSARHPGAASNCASLCLPHTQLPHAPQPVPRAHALAMGASMAGVRAASGWVVGGGVGDQGGRAAQLSLGQCSVTQSEQCVSGESFV